MALQYKILRYTDPAISLDEISTLDTQNPNSPIQSKENAEAMGGWFPLVEINKHKFTNEIRSLSIDETGPIPGCVVSVACSDGVFISTSFPKDGDMLSVFIRSKKNEIKPLRTDFVITNVVASPSIDSSGEMIVFTISGVISIPGFYGEHCKSYSNMTSHDALMQLSQALKLGFASNETTTNDQMNWICGYDTYQKFMTDIVMAAYKDDNSFFKAWIDHNYYLNFLNCNTQFSDELDIDKAFEEYSGNTDYYNDDKIQTAEQPLLLCNHEFTKGFGGHIVGYTLLNNSGSVMMDNGYRRYLQYYDSLLNADTPLDKYVNFFIEPTHTEGVTNKIILRGRANDPNSGKEKRYKWLGTQSDSNAHENYHYALINNWQNNEEIDKLMFYCTLPKCNFNIYKGMRIPVIIINDGSSQRQKMTINPDVQGPHDRVSYDKFLSGYYMVHGFRYTWNSTSTKFTQELYLTRREWPMPNFVPAATSAGSDINTSTSN